MAVKCEHPECTKEATDNLGGIYFCDEHTEWACDILEGREHLNDTEDEDHGL